MVICLCRIRAYGSSRSLAVLDRFGWVACGDVTRQLFAIHRVVLQVYYRRLNSAAVARVVRVVRVQ